MRLIEPLRRRCRAVGDGVLVTEVMRVDCSITGIWNPFALYVPDQRTTLGEHRETYIAKVIIAPKFLSIVVRTAVRAIEPIRTAVVAPDWRDDGRDVAER